MKEAWANNGESLSSISVLCEQCRPRPHQTDARKKWTKEDNKFAITCYLKAKMEGQRGYRTQMHQYWMEEGRSLMPKVSTPQEPVEVLTENDAVEGSDITPVIESVVERDHSAADGGIEGTDQLHQSENTQRIREMMHKNSNDFITSLRGIDALKVKSTVSEVDDIICKIRVKNLDELRNLLRDWGRLVCSKVGVTANKKEFKEPYWEKVNWRWYCNTPNWVELRIDWKADGRKSNIEENMKWEGSVA